MYRKYLLLLIAAGILLSCKKEKGLNNPAPNPPPAVPDVLLKDITVANLPAPYYHFEYDANKKVSFASFASNFTMYNVLYQGNKIGEMRNNIVINKDRLQYTYDNAGRATLITYTDSFGVAFARSVFTYNGDKLVKAEREHKEAAGFVVDRTMTMQYHPDGNLLELSDHRPAANGSPASTVTHRYEQYDNKFNVDAFDLLHPDFFVHFFLLPGITLQKNNPGKDTRTGDGANYQAIYTYTYGQHNCPLTRSGDLTFTSGANVGQKFQTNSTYTYY